MDKIIEAVTKLEAYIESENYRGYDPYDGLSSPLFKIPVLYKSKKIRLYSQQFIKRFPFNIRPLLLITKGYNPVTLGLCIQAYTYLSLLNENKKDYYYQKIDHLINELQKLSPRGFSGACWGYDFDWQSSVVSIPAYGPTVVATGIITNALFQYYKFSGSQTAKELISNSVDFVLKDLNRTNSGDNFCFSYSPFDKQTVYNANMKAVRLLSQAYSITKNDELKCKAKDVVKFVINHQNEEGSWFYSNRNNDKRIDNYHTGYVLDCLDEYIKCTNDNDYINNLNIGFQFYKNLFFDEDGFPKFFHNNKYPLDCTAGAQSILTLIRFGEIEHASRVADYLVVNMQNKEGYFYFRKFKNYTIKTSYMRWSNAWMFAALSYLEYKKSLN